MSAGWRAECHRRCAEFVFEDARHTGQLSKVWQSTGRATVALWARRMVFLVDQLEAVCRELEACHQ